MIDFCSQHGAAELAARLRDYWRTKGHRVTTLIERSDIVKTDNAGLIYSVHSDLIDGLPHDHPLVRP
jgi:hypothetical protein